MKLENPFKKSGAKKEEESKSEGFNRRDFLIGAVASGVVVFAGEKIGTEAANVEKGKTLDDYKRDFSELVNEAELTEKSLVLREEIKQRYGFDVLLEQEEFEGTAAKVNIHADAELRLTKQIEALSTLQEELLRYPDFMIRQYGLEKLSIASLSRDGDSDSSGFHYWGNPDSHISGSEPHIALFYDWNNELEVPLNKRPKLNDNQTKERAASNRRFWRDRSFRGVVHHEFSHFMINGDGGERTPRHLEAQFIENWDLEFREYNEEWRKFYQKIEPAVTANGSSRPDYSKISGQTWGAERGYGLQDEYEDQATIMENIMIYGPHAERLKEDMVLGRKTELLQQYYLDSSCGLMDEAYWKKVQAVGFGQEAQEHFIETAKVILETPHEQSEYKKVIPKDKYETWQNKLRQTDLVKVPN